MTDTDETPREWSIKPQTGHIYPMDPTQSTAGCQVIEKSAYLRVKEERDRLKKLLEAAISGHDVRAERSYHVISHSAYLRIKEELDALTARVAELEAALDDIQSMSPDEATYIASEVARKALKEKPCI